VTSKYNYSDEEIKQYLSAFIDDETSNKESSAVLEALGNDGFLIEKAGIYHKIGEAVRTQRNMFVDVDLTEKVRSVIVDETIDSNVKWRGKREWLTLFFFATVAFVIIVLYMKPWGADSTLQHYSNYNKFAFDDIDVTQAPGSEGEAGSFPSYGYQVYKGVDLNFYLQLHAYGKHSVANLLGSFALIRVVDREDELKFIHDK